ncbi:MAG: PAS domain S-box protein [Pyrinomonadaceae bacterium]|nr:PAS domain S-box protein [Pyrinomonadaceae bacterium]
MTPVGLEALSRCPARLHSIFDYNITGICFADLDGSVAKANEAYLEIVGYSRDDRCFGSIVGVR